MQLSAAHLMNCDVLRMPGVDFQYLARDRPAIVDVDLTVTQVSRVAVIGANGAVKSTVIKVLKPSSWLTT